MYWDIVQPRLSKPLWPAPKSKRSDKQKVWKINIWLTTPTPISFSLPYSKKFSRDPIFAAFVDDRLTMKIKPAN